LTALYVHHPSSLDHETGAHPESPRRIEAIEAALEQVDWLGLELVEAPAATREQLERVHASEHIDSIAELSRSGGGAIDADTVASAGSYNAALHAAGGAIHAVDRLLSDGANGNGNGYGFAFCGLRPPGHHAERNRAMGFCLFNNIAVAAAHALAEHGAERVLIIDWDVHHGNGTEEIFYESNEVLYASLHQSPLYPGTGAATDTGRGEGKGFTINLPLPPGSGREEFLAALTDAILPRARNWKPNLICISAGYDAHRNDPLADCNLATPDYAEMSTAIRDLATDLNVPVLICLEGGYNLKALATSVQATITAFTNLD
jgi:acetoin utilization deacetylase AcuC-like enzyme